MNIQATYIRSFGWYWTGVTFDDVPDALYEEWYNTRAEFQEAWKVDLDYIRAPVKLSNPNDQLVVSEQ